MKKKIIRATTVPMSLDIFCRDMLRELSEDYEVVGVCADGPEFEVIKAREGVKLVKVDMARQISPVQDLKSLVSLCCVFHQERPDMVHSMTPKAGLLCMMAAWLTRVPVRVHTFTGLVWPTASGVTRQILKMTDRITCFCATHVIPEGQGVLEDLRNGHITGKQMKVLGFGNVRGIDLSYWSTVKSQESRVKSQESTDNSPFTFLFVGRIVGDKGINELVKAFVKLIEMIELKNEKVKKCRLVLVGPFEAELDPVAEETRRLIETVPEIEAVGSKYGDELRQCYAESDCFVFPSYREGFPNTVIEAGAMNLPCIVTDINGSREIISMLSGDRLASGERMSIRQNGVVIPSKDEGVLLDAMHWMLTHDEERQQMARSARPMVAARFEQRFVRQQLYDFYREILTSR